MQFFGQAAACSEWSREFYAIHGKARIRGQGTKDICPCHIVAGHEARRPAVFLERAMTYDTSRRGLGAIASSVAAVVNDAGGARWCPGCQACHGAWNERCPRCGRALVALPRLSRIKRDAA